MEYFSTRGASAGVSGAQAVLTGLAPDGGLYLPRQIPEFAFCPADRDILEQITEVFG